ncbi:glycosyltransferase [Hansschlegelia quercus]|uniref:Glycosyltransferase n=1 Tax=Hansschlegelia quercus TaxID=2528245 RepID=A0A4Q9GNW4_9HYPH|nr:glycosyltransferase [Hansschlegelia quercus]TBN53257.1 glycosyltransferase [Hansschlegelia quercus]
MLSVVIPTRNDERALVSTLAALVPAAAEGVVRNVIVADGGSTDATLEVADLAGCDAVCRSGPRCDGLNAAARGSKGPWLMFLEAGVVLEEGWHREVSALVDVIERAGETDRRAAVFRFGFDGFGSSARNAELLAGLWGLLTGLPRPEQGLIIHKSFYDKLGGFRPLPAMTGADLIRRIGSGRIIRLRARAISPAASSRSWREGPRGALGAGLLMLRVPPRFVARLYN